MRTCQHYEFKVAHRYDVKSLAARYVFDLSREVQELVVRLKYGDGSEGRAKSLEVGVAGWPSECVRERKWEVLPKLRWKLTITMVLAASRH